MSEREKNENKKKPEQNMALNVENRKEEVEKCVLCRGSVKEEQGPNIQRVVWSLKERWGWRWKGGMGGRNGWPVWRRGVGNNKGIEEGDEFQRKKSPKPEKGKCGFII